MTLRRQDLDDGVTVLTIDRPEARNALSPEIRGLFAEYCTSMARGGRGAGGGGHRRRGPLLRRRRREDDGEP